jgi:putative copper resistance protein D
MIDVAWLVLRAVSFALTLQAAGMALFRLYLGRLAPHAAAVTALDMRRVAIAALIAVIAQFLIEPAHLAGDLSGLADAQLLHLALAGVGPELTARLAGLTCLALGARRVAPRTLLSLAGAALAVLSFGLSGHVPKSGYAALLVPLLLVHATIVAGWVGALWPLYRATRLEAAPAVALLLAAFSRVAIWLVPVVAVAGVAMAVGLLPDVAALSQPYGLLLLGKTAAYALLLLLAALNKLRLTPAIGRGESAALGTLRGTLLGEYLLLLAALATTAVMSGAYSPS